MTASELYNIFSLNFSIVHFSCLKPFTAYLSFVKTFVDLKNYRILWILWICIGEFFEILFVKVFYILLQYLSACFDVVIQLNIEAQ